MTAAPVLKLRKLSKSFDSTAALTAVDLDIEPASVLGIVGENGAGKSTLLNIVSGIVQPDTGEMSLEDRRFTPANYREARTLGVSRVFQEQALIPNLPVYENLLLACDQQFSLGRQWLNTRAMIEAADGLVREAGLAIDVRKPTSDYSFSKRQLIEIIRACLVPIRLQGIATPIVLLDEPTASLEKADEEIFLRLVANLRQRAALVFISHRLGEVLSLSDRIAVLKDGRTVGEVSPTDANERVLHAMMVGRERAADYYHEREQRDASRQPVVFALHGLSRVGVYADVSLEVREGEILGIGGLLASGTAPLGKGAAGIRPADRGDVEISAQRYSQPRISDLISKGLGYVPAERLAEGMIASLPLSWNLSLASGEDVFALPFGVWNTAKEESMTASVIRSMPIKAAGPNALASTLSGGNQQKIVLARWLCRDLKILLLDNPTRGVDAGAKEEIYRIIRSLTAKGVAILLISDELLELIGLSNRIAIMQHGRIAAMVDAPPSSKPSEQQLIELMLTVPQSRSEQAAA